MTVRRRAVLALLIAFPVGWLYVDIGWRLVVALLVWLRGDDAGSVACSGSGLPHLVGQFNGCDSFHYRHGYALVELIIGTLIAGLVVYGLARFVTAPLRQVTDAVEHLGPTNLGLRIRQRGARRDETKRLADAIDALLDRLAAGYDAQRRFASNASHELRTPLATQRALIEISLASALTPDQLELVARQLLATNERNERLIDGLLTLAETEQGLRSPGSVLLDEVATAAVDGLRGFASEKGVGVELRAEPVSVRGEAPLLERLVANLVQNAIKYNVGGGWVQVYVGPPGELTVDNSGPAVPADEVDGLFEPFRRLQGDRLDHGGGAGLGLTIVRSIVAAHGGTVTAAPRADGGLSVRVRLG